MKKFARHCTLHEIKERCAAQGIEVDTTKHDRDFSDFISLRGIFAGMPVAMVYSVFNGTFIGENCAGEKFTERSPLDGEPWFAAILDLLFVEVAHV